MPADVTPEHPAIEWKRKNLNEMLTWDEIVKRTWDAATAAEKERIQLLLLSPDNDGTTVSDRTWAAIREGRQP